MVEKKDVKATVEVATEAARPTEAKTETKLVAPGRIGAKVEAAVPVRVEAAPIKKEAKAAPAKEIATRKTAAKTTSKRETAPREVTKKGVTPKAEMKKEVATKAVAKKETVKKVPAKRIAESKAAVYLQFDSKDPVAGDVLGRAVKVFKKSHRGVEIKTADLYIVANGGVVYYVVNGGDGGDYEVIL